MNEYDVNYYSGEVDWNQVEILTINKFPWYESGLKQETFVQMAICDGILKLKVKAIDIHSTGEILEENGSVYLDSCFEFFLTPKNKLSPKYMNFEINCIGNLYLAVRGDQGKRRANKSQLEQVKITTSLPFKQVKCIDDHDMFWTLDIEIPLSFIRSFFGEAIDEDFWHGNFYRIGGSIDGQYGVWNPLISEKPNFHLPLQFGRIVLKK